MFTAQGVLKVKNNEVRVSEKFRKREFVLTLEASSQYPQHVQFQLAQDKCSMLDQFNVGEEIKVSFNLRGREWTKDGETRFFNTLDAWRLERVGNAANPMSNPQTQQNSMETGGSPVFSGGSSNTDDLPF